jgi:hypothetical protein
MSEEREVRLRKGAGARRPVLLTVIGLGAVITLVSVNGMFALFTDRATTGANQVSSPPEAASADIQIAAGTRDISDNTIACGTFAEDLITGIITVTDLAPSDPIGTSAVVCLRNVGSRSVDLTVSAIELVDSDTACTGDEAVLDTTCGGDGPGELSAVLTVFTFQYDCVGFGSYHGPFNLANSQSTAFGLTSMPAGTDLCLEFNVVNQAQGDMITISQSDTTMWRFAFDATANSN